MTKTGFSDTLLRIVSPYCPEKNGAYASGFKDGVAALAVMAQGDE
jgi:hypothetical protein